MEGSSHAKNQLDSFSRFDSTPTCDGRTERPRPMASTADAYHRAVKTGRRREWRGSEGGREERKRKGTGGDARGRRDRGSGGEAEMWEDGSKVRGR